MTTQSNYSMHNLPVTPRKRQVFSTQTAFICLLTTTLMLVVGCKNTDHETAKDKQEEVSALLNAAEQNDSKAQYLLGARYELGQGVRADNYTANYWLEKAANNGSVAAQHRLADKYRDGVNGVQKNHEVALHWYQKAAAQGNSSAQYNLGELLEKGENISHKQTEAIQWYESAAKQDFVAAQMRLGIIYRDGIGVPVDTEQARDWLAQAAAHHFPGAQEALDALPAHQ